MMRIQLINLLFLLLTEKRCTFATRYFHRKILRQNELLSLMIWNKEQVFPKNTSRFLEIISNWRQSWFSKHIA